MAQQQQVRFDENVRVTQTSTGQGGQFPQMPSMRGFAQNMPNMSNTPNMQNMPNMQNPQNPQNQDFAHEIGNALTRGGGPGGYLAWYIERLQKNPLHTRMLTSGSLAALQEFLASWIAKDRNKHGNYFTSRVLKMAVYGAFVSAPLGHFMIRIMQRIFKDRTSLFAKIMQIAVSNLIVSPIQNTVYLTSMAVIAGARTFHQIRATIRAGFWPVMRVTWIVSPIALAFAQAFLPQETWVHFFNFISFVIGTYVNAHTKKKRLQALRKKYSDGRGGGYQDSSTTYEQTTTEYDRRTDRRDY